MIAGGGGSIGRGIALRLAREGATIAVADLDQDAAQRTIRENEALNALERTEEFGMMRAVGARKAFITRMFLAETFSLSFVFGGAGILIGVIITWILRPMRIGSGGNEIWELLFGGEVFQPTLGFAGLVLGIVSLGIVTVLAVIYPLVVARKITPLDAINRH